MAQNIVHRFLNSEVDALALTIPFTDFDPCGYYNFLNDHNIHLKCDKSHKIGSIQYHILRVSLPYFETESRINFAVSEIDYFLSQQNENY